MLPSRYHDADRYFAGEYEPLPLESTIQNPRRPREYGLPSLLEDAELEVVAFLEADD